MESDRVVRLLLVAAVCVILLIFFYQSLGLRCTLKFIVAMTTTNLLERF